MFLYFILLDNKLKVIFSDESGPNLNFVEAMQNDSRGLVESGLHFRFSKILTYIRIHCKPGQVDYYHLLSHDETCTE